MTGPLEKQYLTLGCVCVGGCLCLETKATSDRGGMETEKQLFRGRESGDDKISGIHLPLPCVHETTELLRCVEAFLAKTN